MKVCTRHILCVLAVSSFWALTGCATLQTPVACNALDPEEYQETHDPLESFNRDMFEFNESTDKAIYQPVARTYKAITPDPVETSVSSFYRNLKEPRNIVSSLLAGRTDITAESSIRFTMNSTLGLLGLIDLAGHAGIPYNDYDFGHMLGAWGVGEGPYVVWPFTGPSNMRDTAGSAIHLQVTYVEKRIKKSEHQLFVQVGSAVDSRARLLPFTELLDQQPDPYLFARESYRQARLNTICNP